MSKLFGPRVRLGLVLAWTIPSVILLLGVSIAMLRDPRFPFGLGLIQTRGPRGLWAAAPPGLLGVTAVALLFWRRQLGARLLFLYCLFWIVCLGGGVVKDWHDIVPQNPPSESIANWLPAMLIVVGMVIGFLLVGRWAWGQARSARS